jgi:hypothetical protein
MAGRYTGSYLGRFNGWRAVTTLADTCQASLVGRGQGGDNRFRGVTWLQSVLVCLGDRY